MQTDTPSKKPKPWWGALSLNRQGRWTGSLGPLRLWIDVSPGQYTIEWHQGSDPLEPGRSTGASGQAPDDAERVRIVTSDPSPRLRPALADRPVVVRPESPLHVAPGDTATLLVSSPVWVQVTAGEPSRVLLDVPSFRPSDTWFGPTPRVGELCYASRTRARLRHRASSPTHARAHTELDIVNEGEDVLIVERISLPVPRLALYEAPDGVLWTEGLSVLRPAGDELAEVTIQRGPPSNLLESHRAAEPRSGDPRSVFARAVSSLLG